MPYLPRPADFDPYIGSAEADAVIREYTSKPWQRIAQFKQGPRTVGNGENDGTARKMFLRFAGQDYLLKQAPWYCDRPSHVRAVAHLQQRLAASGKPAATLEPTSSGERVCSVQYGSELRLYTLQHVVRATIWSGSLAECVEGGCALAGLHAAVPELLVPSSAAQISRHDVFTIARAAIALGSLQIDKDEPHRRGASGTRNLLTHFSHVVEQLRRESLARGYFECVRVIHGDINPTNMVYSAGCSIAAFVDFDNCCRDHPAHDVARGLVHFGCFPTTPAMNRFQHLPSSFRDDLGEGFLVGYQRSAPDWPDVAAVLPYVAGCITVELCVLALLNGWFGTNEMPRMVDLPRSVVDWVQGLISKVWNHD